MKINVQDGDEFIDYGRMVTMGWKQNDDGTWCFTHREGESWEEAFQRCMKGENYTAGEEIWLALLVMATDVIGDQLNHGGTPKPFGANFRVANSGNVEAQPQNTQSAPRW